MEKAVRMGIRRAYSNGRNPDISSLVIDIVDAIDMAEEFSQPQATGPHSDGPIDFPLVNTVKEEPEPQAAVPLPSSPAVAEDTERRMILTPREARAKPATPPKTHEVISTPDGEPWQLETLIQEMHQVTPPTIRIEVEVPDKGPMELELSRNIQAGHGFGAVKVSYKHDAAGDDLAVFQTVMLEDSEVDITAMMDDLHVRCVHAYRPRPREIRSSTPVRVGKMNFDLKTTPHDQTDP